MDVRVGWIIKNSVPKNWYFWTVVLEKTLENPLDCKEIKAVNPKGYQSWIFIGRTDTEAEAPVLWPPDGKNWLTGKDPDPGKDWRQEEKGTTGDQMVGWHHRLNGHKSEQALGVGDGQGSLACCSLWGCKELDTTEWLNWPGISCLTLVTVGFVAPAVDPGCLQFVVYHEGLISLCFSFLTSVSQSKDQHWQNIATYKNKQKMEVCSSWPRYF